MLPTLGAYRVYMIYSCLSTLFFTMLATYNLVYQSVIIGLNPLQLVLVGTVLETIVFVFEVPTGIVADVYSRRLSIILGVFMIGVGFTIEGAVPRFEAVLLSQLIWGIGATFTSGATSAWITDEVGEEAVGPVFMRGAQWGQLGSLLGVIVGTGLAAVAVNLPVVVGGLAHIGLAVFLIAFMPETGFHPTPTEDRTTFGQMVHTFRAGLKVVRVRPVLIMLLLVGAIWGMASEGIDRLGERHFLDNFTLPAVGGLSPVVWFGIMGVIGSLTALAATEFTRRRVDTTQPRALAGALIVISGLLATSVIVFALAQQFALAMAAALMMGTMRSVNYPLFQTWLNQHIDSGVRATVLSMTSQVDALGQIAGGPGIGYIGWRVSVRAALFVAGLLLTPILALYGWSLRRAPVVEEAAVV